MNYLNSNYDYKRPYSEISNQDEHTSSVNKKLRTNEVSQIIAQESILPGQNRENVAFNTLEHHLNRNSLENSGDFASFQINLQHPPSFAQQFPHTYYGMLSANNFTNIAKKISTYHKKVPQQFFNDYQTHSSLQTQFRTASSLKRKHIVTTTQSHLMGTTIESFPNDILFRVFQLFQLASLRKIASVSKKWNVIANEVQINQIIQDPNKPIDIGLSDALLLAILRKHGSKLRSLNLGARQINDNLLKELIEHCPNLCHLFIKSNKVSDQGLAHLKGLSALQTLSLDGCTKITDAGLAHINGLSGLKTLNLNKCRKITDAGLAHLSKLSALQKLNLKECTITDADLAPLKGLAALKTLNLDECVRISDAGLVHLRELYALQTLNLGGCTITDAGLVHLKELYALQTLNLSDCNDITDAGLAHLRRLSALQTLSLGGCTKITDAGLVHLRRLYALQTLNFEFSEITGAGLAHLNELPVLQTLKLDHGKKFTAAGLAPLKGLHALKKLSLVYCQGT
ncbi:MAG: hypothetical protein H0V82_04960 [Candidatus Protochlamydia sp.]|nr:hypothetical protein [Candidatus Protochlamydia sp.]